MAIISKLGAVELRGKDHDRIERLHFEVEHAVTLMDSAGSGYRFSQDMYIVTTLLEKLSHASAEKWNEYADSQSTPVVRGVNEWTVFREWLAKGYRLAKRARISAGLPAKSPAQLVPTKPAPAKPICGKCRRIGHRASECKEEPERGAIFAIIIAGRNFEGRD